MRGYMLRAGPPARSLAPPHPCGSLTNNAVHICNCRFDPTGSYGRIQGHPLHSYVPWYTAAGRHGHVGVLRLAMQAGEAPRAMAAALCLACRHGQAAAVQELLSYAVPHDVAVQVDVTVVGVDQGHETQRLTPLQCACAAGHVEIAMTLVGVGGGRPDATAVLLLFRLPGSLTSKTIPAARWLLLPGSCCKARCRLDRGRLAPFLLSRADGPETEQQLLALCSGNEEHLAAAFRWAVRQGRVDLVRQLAQPASDAHLAAVKALGKGLQVWNRDLPVHAVPPAMLAVLQEVGAKTWDGPACVARALVAGSMADVRAQLAAAAAGGATAW